MCTVSWIHEADGYHLLCNRDEKNTRKPASAPELHARGSVRFAAPVDGDFGGSWIAVNEFGLSLCLLNGRPPGVRMARASRGLLVHELIGESSASGVCDALQRCDVSMYAPFTLAVLEPDSPVAVAEWNGESIAITRRAQGLMPLTSSSLDPQGVARRRNAEFARMARGQAVDAALLCRFHESHATGPSAYSTCMHRSDAATVSFSWIKVRPFEIDFFYSPAAPCQWQPGRTLTMARRCPTADGYAAAERSSGAEDRGVAAARFRRSA